MRVRAGRRSLGGHDVSDAQITLASWALVISLILIAYSIRFLIQSHRLIRQARVQIAEAQAHLDEAGQRLEQIREGQQ